MSTSKKTLVAAIFAMSFMASASYAAETKTGATSVDCPGVTSDAKKQLENPKAGGEPVKGSTSGSAQDKKN